MDKKLISLLGAGICLFSGLSGCGISTGSASLLALAAVGMAIFLSPEEK